MPGKRGQGRPSIGEERARLLAKAEKGNFGENKKRKRDEVEAAEPAGVEVVDGSGEVESLGMSWNAMLRHGKPVAFDVSSGVSMELFLNNVCLHDVSSDSLKAFLSVKYTVADTNKHRTVNLCTLTPDAPHACLQGVRFHSSDTPQLIVNVVGKDEEVDISKARVTVCGEQVMHLTEAQIAALLL
eukprot:TRINITY_DN32171_c0_g1_i1.p1 TRINITY_DN32171_c0_g1~~TRINITY_DN32171_c0_g1_i1.p1  ORF type:complete len:206 (+),score=81.80 TRINITY_DN32171_c0_g1_i1:65-619(+)